MLNPLDQTIHKILNLHSATGLAYLKVAEVTMHNGEREEVNNTYSLNVHELQKIARDYVHHMTSNEPKSGKVSACPATNVVAREG